MKKFCIFWLMLVLALIASASQDKRVYITLDVSGSMTGDKYALANYTSQMIVTLCDDDDEVSMFVYGIEKKLSGNKDPLKAIQKPMRSLDFGSRLSWESQFDDIIGFNKVYKPSKQKQDWLFIIGDGDWATNIDSYASDREKFQQTVEGGTLNVCYLQTGFTIETDISREPDFTRFVRPMGVIDIGKSDTNPQTIKAGCDHFAKKILGFSEVSLGIKKDGSQGIKVECELPIKEFIVVYQDEVNPQQLPTITAAQYGSKKMAVHHKGTPTTQPLKDDKVTKTLSGNVWRLKAGETIPAKTPVVIVFDKAVSTDKVSIYPLVEVIRFGSVGLTRVGGGLVQIDDKTFGICLDEKTALVHIGLNEDCRENLPEELLKKTKVVVKANNKEYPATFKDGGFEAIIELPEEKTSYYAECDCPGYFSRVTPIQTIVKDKEHCTPPPPPKPIVKRQETAEFGTMSFDRLMKEPIVGTLHDSETLETLDPEKFDIEVKVERGYLYDDPKVSLQGNNIILDVHPKGAFCECLFPTDLNIEVVSTPKPGAFEDSERQYVQNVHPVHLKVDKSRPWAVRCFWVLMTIAALLLLCLYLRALMRKRRFKKNAMMTPRYYSYFGDLIEDQGGTRLRREGFGLWLARWFLPFDERTTLNFDRPQVSSMTLIAAESKNVVYLPKSCCDFETMDIGGYDPESDPGKSKNVKIGDLGTIEFTALNGSKDGELVFSSGSEDDGAGYRLFLGLLLGASLLTIGALVILMVSSL